MVLKRLLFCNLGGPSSSTVNYNVHKSWKENVQKLVEMMSESKMAAFFYSSLQMHS